MMKLIRSVCFIMLLSNLLTGCQSQPAKEQLLPPEPLAVFKHETVWLTTSSLNTHQDGQIYRFNLKLRNRLKLYGAENIQTLNHPNHPMKGLVIVSQINTDSTENTYQLSILRENRELISGSYPLAPEGEQIAINQFLMSIHHKIANANSYF